MIIEEGKYYRSRIGEKIGPMYERFTEGPDGQILSLYAWGSDTGGTFTPEGKWDVNKHESPDDLIEEWFDDTLIRQGPVTEQVTATHIAFLEAYEEAATKRAHPVRVQILHEGAALTNGARDAEYGPPGVNMAAAGELKAVFRRHIRRDISQAELEAIDLALTKLGRIATGSKPKRDTYVDCATYVAIAGEIALSSD